MSAMLPRCKHDKAMRGWGNRHQEDSSRFQNCRAEGRSKVGGPPAQGSDARTRVAGWSFRVKEEKEMSLRSERRPESLVLCFTQGSAAAKPQRSNMRFVRSVNVWTNRHCDFSFIVFASRVWATPFTSEPQKAKQRKGKNCRIKQSKSCKRYTGISA